MVSVWSKNSYLPIAFVQVRIDGIGELTAKRVLYPFQLVIIEAVVSFGDGWIKSDDPRTVLWITLCKKGRICLGYFLRVDPGAVALMLLRPRFRQRFQRLELALRTDAMFIFKPTRACIISPIRGKVVAMLSFSTER